MRISSRQNETLTGSQQSSKGRLQSQGTIAAHKKEFEKSVRMYKIQKNMGMLEKHASDAMDKQFRVEQLEKKHRIHVIGSPTPDKRFGGAQSRTKDHWKGYRPEDIQKRTHAIVQTSFHNKDIQTQMSDAGASFYLPGLQIFEDKQKGNASSKGSGVAPSSGGVQIGLQVLSAGAAPSSSKAETHNRRNYHPKQLALEQQQSSPGWYSPLRSTGNFKIGETVSYGGSRTQTGGLQSRDFKQHVENLQKEEEEKRGQLNSMQNSNLHTAGSPLGLDQVTTENLRISADNSYKAGSQANTRKFKSTNSFNNQAINKASNSINRGQYDRAKSHERHVSPRQHQPTSFITEAGFIDMPRLGQPKTPLSPVRNDGGLTPSESELHADSTGKNTPANKEDVARITGDPIKFIQQRGQQGLLMTSRSQSVTPFFSTNKFGDRINDAARMLRQSWDRHVEKNGANQSGSATKLVYGSTLAQNNYVRFDKQTSRDHYHGHGTLKVHPGRFVYMPESQFDTKGRNVAFSKTTARDPNKFLGIDFREMKDATVTVEDKLQMSFKVGKTALKNIPVSRDPKLVYRAKPLADASIAFNLQLSRPEIAVMEEGIPIKQLGHESDLYDSYNNLGHVVSPGKTVNYTKGVPTEPRSKQYQSMPRFMVANSNRNGVDCVSEKTLADLASENWQFYDPESTFKIYSNSQISQKTAELKALMQEKNQMAISKRLENFDHTKGKSRQSRTPIWQRSPSRNQKCKPESSSSFAVEAQEQSIM